MHLVPVCSVHWKNMPWCLDSVHLRQAGRVGVCVFEKCVNKYIGKKEVAQYSTYDTGIMDSNLPRFLILAKYDKLLIQLPYCLMIV